MVNGVGLFIISVSVSVYSEDKFEMRARWNLEWKRGKPVSQDQLRVQPLCHDERLRARWEDFID